MNDKINFYVSMCYKYGVITLCYLIEEYSNEENYEECNIIYKAIKKIDNNFNLNLPTTFDDNSFKWLKKELLSINPNFNFDTYIDSTPHYANQIKKEIKLIYK
jgi:hypothetical protein